jgi:predicted XRE-type DNA-binding protein
MNMASAKTYSFDDYVTEQMRNPEFKAEYDALEGEFNFIQQMINLRLKKGLSQRQLADLVGTHQPSISRLEAGRIGSIAFLQKVANALDASVEIRFVPHKSASARNARSRTTLRASKRRV